MSLELNRPTQQSLYTTYFVEVLLPLPFSDTYTYRVPQELNEYMEIGRRVIVQFGKKKVYTGIIYKIHETPPKGYEAKYIIDIVDETPSINSKQIEFFSWMSEYYLCPKGAVINAALPAGLKISSESRVQLNPEFSIEDCGIQGIELHVLKKIKESGTLTYQELGDLISKGSVSKLIKNLLSVDAVILFEHIKDKYQPKKEKRIRLHEQLLNEDALNHLLGTLNNKAKQKTVIQAYLGENPIFENLELNNTGVLKSDLKDLGCSTSSLKTLIKNNVFEEFEVVVSRFTETPPDLEYDLELNPEQDLAHKEIHQAFEEDKPCLLHGITGSGKTEIYIKLIQESINNGDQVLYLLPEIALTTQIVERLRQVFGSKMGIYHSKFSDNERVEIWNGVKANKYDFVVGVRSGIFLPFDNLGLIIVDEEHDASYKQYEPNPRFNARDSALMLARIHHCKILLGSATPSVESYYKTKLGQWTLVELFKRYGTAQLPEIVAEKKIFSNKEIKLQFTPALSKSLADTLEEQKQAIIFQNKRGYSPYIICGDCSNIPKCNRCDVSLTYHFYNNELRCHYCGHSQGIPTNCESCGSTKLKTAGQGTERIEDDLKIIFPDANIQRMDHDTTRNKNAYQNIIDAFANGQTDILVGTQMITKGLDFGNVNLVGVYDADSMLNFPDFRATERAFQTMVQVSGRAGRREEKGKVIIQTFNPKQLIFQWVKDGDYTSFFHKEITEREKFAYPPFCRIIRITCKSLDKNQSTMSASFLAKLLSNGLGNGLVYGPEEPMISKIRDQYLTNVTVKVDDKKMSLKKVKEFILSRVDHLKQMKDFQKIQVIIDVDPQ